MGTQPAEIIRIFSFFFYRDKSILVINVPGNFVGRESNISFTVVMKVKLDF